MSEKIQKIAEKTPDTKTNLTNLMTKPCLMARQGNYTPNEIDDVSKLKKIRTLFKIHILYRQCVFSMIIIILRTLINSI